MNNISSKINFPSPEKFDEKLFNKFSKLNKKGKNIFGYMGTNVIQAMFNLYLLKKYKSDCFLYNEDEEFRLFGLQFYIFNRKTKANMEKKEIEQKQMNSIADTFIECIKRNVKIIIIPIIIDDVEHEDSHSNILIYRNNYNEIEHFEPHGSYYMLEEEQGDKTKKLMLNFIEIINSKLKKNKMKPINFIPSEEVCPVIDGFQALEAESKLNEEEEGYCQIWSNFFTEVCLRNPEMKGSELFKICMDFFKNKKNIEDYLRRIIRGYNGIIDDKIKKYLTILYSEDIDAEKINDLMENDYDKYSDLRRLLLELIKLENYMITNKNFDLKKEINGIDVEIRKNRFYKNLTKEEKISLLMKKKILENYEKFDKFSSKTSSLKDDEKTTILSLILENTGESPNEIVSTINDIQSIKESKETKKLTAKSPIISILSEESFQPKKRTKKAKNIIETETEIETEEEIIQPIKRKGKTNRIIETETEEEEEIIQPIKRKGKTNRIIDTKTETEEIIKFPSFNLESTKQKPLSDKSSVKLKSKTQKSQSKVYSKTPKSKKSSIRIKSTNRTIDEERCKEGQFYSTKEMSCVNIKSIKKTPKTKVNIYSLKSPKTRKTTVRDILCKKNDYYDKRTKKCEKLDMNKIRIPPFITENNRLTEEKRNCVEKLLDCSM